MKRNRNSGNFIIFIIGIYLSCFSLLVVAKEDPEKEINTLTMLNMVAEFDELCDQLSDDERSLLQYLIEVKAEVLGITPEILRQNSSETPYECDMQLFIDMTDSIKQFLGEMLQENNDTRDDQSNEGVRPEIFNELEKAYAPLPKGKLKALVGCWRGDLKSWDLEICFGENGDSLSASLIYQKSGITCELPKGSAREREGSALFYAYSDNFLCSDGSRLEHLEGLCTKIDNTLDCLFSVYEHDNYFFIFNGTELSGAVWLNRLE